MDLSKDQIARYSRQLILPEIGVAGQERLLRGSVLIVGAGGLGSPAALYLAAAGVGRIGLVDRDAVALGNLHRQILHTSADVGRPKTRSAAERLAALNPDIAVVEHQEALQGGNALELLGRYDVILDGSDNFPTRYLVNDACVLLGKPLIHGGVVHVGGQLMTVRPRTSACFRCVFPEPPQPGAIPSCQDAGVLGTVAGVLGSLMAHEAIKLLVGVGTPLVDRLLVFEGRSSRWREVPVRRDPSCAVCGDQPTITELVDIEGAVCTTNEEEPWHGNRSR
jgi:adenylyltransferase/sulfurtransferase